MCWKGGVWDMWHWRLVCFDPTVNHGYGGGRHGVDYLSDTAGYGVSYGLGKESFFALAYHHCALLPTMTGVRVEEL